MRLDPILILGVLALSACGESSSPLLKTPLTCIAGLMESTSFYSVQNESLILASTTLMRVAAGAVGRAVYGTWRLADQTGSGVNTKGTLQVAPTSLTETIACNYADGRATTAQVTAPATITDTEITIEQDMLDTVPFAIYSDPFSPRLPR